MDGELKNIPGFNLDLGFSVDNFMLCKKWRRWN